eukprot:scaffold128682_cov63-Phaeocystis_antarctica.AAC.1
MSRPDVMSIHSHWQMSSANAQPRNVWSHWDDVYTIATTPDRTSYLAVRASSRLDAQRAENVARQVGAHRGEGQPEDAPPPAHLPHGVSQAGGAKHEDERVDEEGEPRAALPAHGLTVVLEGAVRPTV